MSSGPGVFHIEPIITVAWSLSYEMLYYVVLPPLLLLFGMRGRSRRWRIGFFGVAAAAIVLAGSMYGGPMRLAMFIAGILLHEAIAAKLAVPRTGMVAILVAASLVFMTAPYSGPAAWAARVSTLFCAFFFLCQHCFTQPQSWLGRAFSLTPLRWLGNMSYSYYLVHGLALKVLVLVLQALIPQVAHETAFVLGILPLAFVLTLLPSAALFLLVEKPLSLKPRSAQPGIKKPPGTAARAV